jgi:hypothetical protein
VHCAKPHGKFEICEVSINYCNISVPEVKERRCGEREYPGHHHYCVAYMKVWEKGVMFFDA